MNLERLFKTIKDNYHRLANKDEMMNFLEYHIKLYQWKMRRLKLGAIVFEIKETIFYGIVVLEDVDIRYIRQDNTKTDEMKLENRLKAIGWKWDVKNVLAFLIVIFGLLCELYTHLNYWYKKNLPTLASRYEHLDYVLKYGFEHSVTSGTIGCFKEWSKDSLWLVEVLTNFCTHFHIIF